MEFTIENDHIKGDLRFGELTISPDETYGYRPYELFVSSLAGCSGSLLRTILTKRRIAFEKIEMQVSAVRNPDYANRIEQLSFSARVYAEESFAPQQAEKIAHLVVKNCGMIQSVTQSIDIKFSIQCIHLNGSKN
ncbi:osmotically inducible protein C [Siminovitchia terrae]|uniref:OsmC family protein n=1 Tax=Siminovitchia terrae TaxID=1914933 RepID=UPI001B1D07F6|nr:OsmC family protein [Siminovitchia terrae]GIN90900.1 osmotically inducible protein C [Siminovitchia terrae]